MIKILLIVIAWMLCTLITYIVCRKIEFFDYNFNDYNYCALAMFICFFSWWIFAICSIIWFIFEQLSKVGEFFVELLLQEDK